MFSKFTSIGSVLVLPALIRNGIEQNYTKISAAFYHDIKNLHTLPQYIDQEAIR